MEGFSMDKKKAPWEVWASRLVNAVSIAALGYFVLFVDFSNHGRIWDKLAARIPVLAKIIPLASRDSNTQITKNGPAAEDSNVDRTLIVTEQAPAQASQPPAVEPIAAATPAQTSKKSSPTPHLTSSLPSYNIHDNSQNTIISVPTSATQQTTQAAAAPSATTPTPSQNVSAPAIAAKASYGTAGRSDIMGQAAGPVYNLTGKGKKK